MRGDADSEGRGGCISLWCPAMCCAVLWPAYVTGLLISCKTKAKQQHLQGGAGARNRLVGCYDRASSTDAFDRHRLFLSFDLHLSPLDRAVKLADRVKQGCVCCVSCITWWQQQHDVLGAWHRRWAGQGRTAVGALWLAAAGAYLGWSQAVVDQTGIAGGGAAHCKGRLLHMLVWV